MAITKTGFKFLDSGVEKDFADIFTISNPDPGITTGFISGAYSKDLGKIFTGGNSGIPTSFKNKDGIDLGSLFTTIPTEPYATTGTVTKTFDGTYNTILTWTTNGSIIFYQSSIIVNYTVIGGGAGGSSGSSSNFNGGAGGSNGQRIDSLFTPTTSKYNITVASTVNNNTYGYSSSIVGIINALGGTVNLAGIAGIAGSPGGNGGNGGANTGNGGGGGGGGATSYIQSGLGGTGNIGGGNGGNGGTIYNGGSGSGSPGLDGENSTGGGGGGGGGSAIGYSIAGVGGKGGSGTVVLRFTV